MKKNGFSMAEIIVAIGIITVVGLVVSGVLTRSFRTGTESEQISQYKENGQLALNNLDADIRAAEAIICYGTTDGSKKDRIVIRSREGIYNKFRFVEPLIQGNVVTANGYIAKEENLDPEGMDSFCTTNLVGSEIALTDKDLENGVSITSGEFIKISGTGGKDAVTIKFEVGPPGNTELGVKPLPMQTTVQVR